MDALPENKKTPVYVKVYDKAVQLAKDPITWVVGGMVGSFILGTKLGMTVGHKKGVDDGKIAGAIFMAKEYNSMLNAYKVPIPENLWNDINAGRVWFLKPGRK